MTKNPYQVFGTSVPLMLGRRAVFRRIDHHLKKHSPDHVSVVGPRHYGKSVLLHHLAEKYRAESSGYLTTVYIDLRHGTPGSDTAFKRRLAEEIKKALHRFRPQLSDLIDSELTVTEDEGVYELLDYVFSAELEGEDERILVVLDGFDYLLAGPGVTRNLWDQLRSLAQKTSLRLVTGSRLPLRELCRTEESRTSDFWEIFCDTPVRVAALDHDDWDPFLQPLLETECELDNSARKEITNWTGGVPVLVCAVLKELWGLYRGARVSKLEIDAAAETTLERRRELLAALWEDCEVDLRDVLGKLADADIPLSDISDDCRRTLEDRGYGRVSRNRIRGSCRLIQRYAGLQAPTLTNLTSLFGEAADFETHIGSLLELRLRQVADNSVDSNLRNFVRSAVKNIGDPKLAIYGVRGIVERALVLIWKAELPRFPKDRSLPAPWLDKCRRVYGDRLKWLTDTGHLPTGSGQQCHVLRLITGSDRMERHSQYVTKTTCLLVDHLHSVGNFGQHLSNYSETKVSVGFAAAVLLAAISLVESLTSDLQRVGGS